VQAVDPFDIAVGFDNFFYCYSSIRVLACFYSSSSRIVSQSGCHSKSGPTFPTPDVVCIE
jgi:hypothetical protein